MADTMFAFVVCQVVYWVGYFMGRRTARFVSAERPQEET
jgi:hypothetical protein